MSIENLGKPANPAESAGPKTRAELVDRLTAIRQEVNLLERQMTEGDKQFNNAELSPAMQRVRTEALQMNLSEIAQLRFEATEIERELETHSPEEAYIDPLTTTTEDERLINSASVWNDPTLQGGTDQRGRRGL